MLGRFQQRKKALTPFTEPFYSPGSHRQGAEQAAITATTDARFPGLYWDTPALVYGPAADAIHGFNERVDLESMRRVTQSTVLFIAGWCGLEKT